MQNGQSETINNFRHGRLNLLISTTVAEEGLDIPECNLVVRYGLLTNEIAQQQATGRARATDSIYSLVALQGGREERKERTNEYLEELTGKAIAKVQEMSRSAFLSKVRMHDLIPYLTCCSCRHIYFFFCLQLAELQKKAVEASEAAESIRMEKRSLYAASSVQLMCRNCYKVVASGSDINLIGNGHYVNVNPDFK